MTKNIAEHRRLLEEDYEAKPVQYWDGMTFLMILRPDDWTHLSLLEDDYGIDTDKLILEVAKCSSRFEFAHILQHAIYNAMLMFAAKRWKPYANNNIICSNSLFLIPLINDCLKNPQN